MLERLRLRLAHTVMGRALRECAHAVAYARGYRAGDQDGYDRGYEDGYQAAQFSVDEWHRPAGV